MMPDLTLTEALLKRRSRRFGLGMKIPGGPLQYESRFSPVPLSEEEEASLVFAAGGVTGHALADLSYEHNGGGSIMAGFVARTIASGDGLQTVALALINDSGAWLIKRPREMPPAQIFDLIEHHQRGRFVEAYRKSRVRLASQRVAPPREPMFNINANRWSVHAPGSTYFLPINDLTLMYVNGLLEIFNEHTAAFILDDRNHFQPAGLAKFGRNRGGHLESDPSKGRTITVRQVEQFVTEFVTVEQGMMLQNLGLMAHALGLGGFPNFANHEFAWFEALGFTMQKMPAAQYLGASRLASFAMNILGRNPSIPYAVGLERDGEVLLKPFCPPYYRTMSEAVEAVVNLKFGATGIYRSDGHGSAWARHAEVTNAIAPISDATIAATKAYCEYLWQRYGRFPVYLPPFRTVLGFQAAHLDAEFYDRFYRPGALGERQREDFAKHSASAPLKSPRGI